tara:strand:+ start:11675 stop:12193 length:519 start_codon:yes stop_codon:yes gene_type:complete
LSSRASQEYKINNIAMNKIPLTINGAQKLEEELKMLKAQRSVISESIATAREHGDLKENAEYHAAKDQQGLAEARIRDIESKLSNSEIIDVSKINARGKIIFGSTVKLNDLSSNEARVYQLVGEDEADIKSGLLSIISPLARAIIGKEEGDIVEITTPGGKIEYEILSIKYI